MEKSDLPEFQQALKADVADINAFLKKKTTTKEQRKEVEGYRYFFSSPREAVAEAVSMTLYLHPDFWAHKDMMFLNAAGDEDGQAVARRRGHHPCEPRGQGRNADRGSSPHRRPVRQGVVVKKLAIAIAVAGSLLLGGSQAKAVDMKTGNFVLKECNNSSSFCWGFLNGMVNASQRSRQTCILSGVLWTQIRIVAVRYLNRYPRCDQQTKDRGTQQYVHPPTER